MGLLEGKNILIMGISNKWSIAWGIAQSCIDQGARLIATYQNERMEKSVSQLLTDYPDTVLLPCDVTKDEEVAALFDSIKEKVGVIHGMVHSLAFAKTQELQGEFINTSRDGYALAQDISAYSLVTASKYARPLMTEGGSIVTMTYLGGERAVKNYNVMGVAKAALEACVRYLSVDLGTSNVRINSISAGPIKTVSAKGIRDFNSVLKFYEEKAPLKKMVTPNEIGDTAAFLLSNLSRGITGENIHVDAGYHVVGL